MIDPRAPDFSNTPASKRRPEGRFAPRDPHAPPAVSVVTPFFRPGALFRETARSVFAQTLQQWEWVIVNDGSTDRESLAALDEVRDRDPRIRVIEHDENRGPPSARNTGMAAARAGYVYLLDDDDLIEPTTLEKALWYLEARPDCAFAGSWSVGFGAREYLWSKGFERGGAFLTDNLATSHVMLRASVFEQTGGFDETLVDGFEDWDFWLRCADRGLWGGTIPEYLDWYRRRADHGDRWKDFASPRSLERFRARVRERYPRLGPESFPSVPLREAGAYAPVPEGRPCENGLASGRRRLLLVVPWLTLGGADGFNLDVVEQLSRRGWEVTVAATLEGDHSWEPAFARHTPDVFVLPRFLPHVDHPRFLRALIDSRRPDVVMVSNSELGYLLLPWLRAHAPGPAYVDMCHMEEEGWKSGGYPRYAVGMQPCLDLNLVASRHLARWMEDRGAAPETIEVLHINVDPERWRPDPAARARLRAAWSVADTEPVLLFAGRLCRQKQPRVLARTLRALARRGVCFRAVVAGEGEDRAELEAFVRAHGLARKVIFAGAVPRESMRELMSAADVFFLPSEWEGIALSLYEAMAMGLAVVGADVGGQSELVTPGCGALLPRAAEEVEVRAYADALERLLTDPAQRRALGRAARERVEEGFRLDQMVDRLERLLERARARAARRDGRPLSHALAREWASQAVEHLRVARAADALWVERECQRATRDGAPGLIEELGWESELAAIEASRSWQRVNRWARGRLLRTLLGTDPASAPSLPAESPRARLARIKASRRYRLIVALKRLPGYGVYARRRYGPGWRTWGD